jgi:hypothetical protein
VDTPSNFQQKKDAFLEKKIPQFLAHLKNISIFAKNNRQSDEI